MVKQLYQNVGRYARLILRRDRIRIPVWIICLIVITIVVVPAFQEMYGTQLERQAIAETMRNPAMIAMVGPSFGLDNYTIGAMMGHQMLLFTAIAVAIMAILLVARHTRADEEAGRIELLRSLPVGRLSNLAAVLLVLFLTYVLLAALTGFSMYSLGEESMDLAGSLLYGALLGSVGIFFAAVTAFFAQLSESSRGTIGLSFTFLGVAYLVRAIGDVSNETLSMLSPLGWIMHAQVYVNDYWWPVFALVGAAIVIGAIALKLNSTRDLGAGFIAAKPGRSTASAFLQSPLGLNLKLQRTMIIAWLIGMFVLGASYGSVFGDLEAFFAESEMMQQILPPGEGFTLAEQFMTMIMSIMSMVAAIPALLITLKLLAEENKNRTEHLLARAVSRINLMASFLSVALVVGFLSMLLSAFGMWAAAAAVMEDTISLNSALSASAVYLPAIGAMVGLAAFLVGVLPKGAGLTWLYLGYSFIVVYLGNLLQFPEWMATLSPFGNVPQVPLEDFNLTAVTVLSIVAVLLLAVALRGYRQRDIHG
ncbi:ABC transporter permease [Dethiobacter alkaliphilus]|uniref:ABC transporter permease n=1 Tax=Dethiobacter alkaliphilus TaxID=427926 RepID=UPI002227E2D5|nr:ABC-2 transporter permease [Dethiobacter alkaliphilus]MCW3490667.1 ABC-2 transporter permease [Dethiobacter alkaliphilus]